MDRARQRRLERLEARPARALADVKPVTDEARRKVEQLLAPWRERFESMTPLQRAKHLVGLGPAGPSPFPAGSSGTELWNRISRVQERLRGHALETIRAHDGASDRRA